MGPSCVTDAVFFHRPKPAGQSQLSELDGARKRHVKVPKKPAEVSRRQATGLRIFFKSDCRAFSPPYLRKKVMLTLEARLREELRNCSVELRQLAYTLHNGIGEHDLLRLSERMRATADEAVRSGA
jgi:hypothetical protein